MEIIYNQLYHTYVCPAMSQTDREHREIIEDFINRLALTQDKQMIAYDLITYIRYQWGLASFTYGVRMGMELLYAPDRAPEDYPTLLDFLTKLDEPVS